MKTTTKENPYKMRIRTAPELARMFWKESKYGDPMVDGLQLCREERDTIAKALVNFSRVIDTRDEK